jgi:parvulin-like peptidyl-prolyl isomerase
MPRIGIRYAAPESLRERHILLATEAGTSAVLSRLNTGEDFVTLAKALSKNPGSAEGGDLWLSDRNALVKSLDDAAFVMALDKLQILSARARGG